jgi:putative oxidoreductase
VVTIIELRVAFTRPGDPLTHIILASLAAGLALVGPGAWSIDARLYGWKRVDLPTPKR